MNMRIWGRALVFLLAACADRGTLSSRAKRLRAEHLDVVETTIEARDVSDTDVLEAMRTAPRHLFVPPDFEKSAYADHPMPIGYG